MQTEEQKREAWERGYSHFLAELQFNFSRLAVAYGHVEIAWEPSSCYYLFEAKVRQKHFLTSKKVGLQNKNSGGLGTRVKFCHT